MLFNELRKHGKLAAKRHPMYEKNKFGKFFMYFMAIFWTGYLIFFGVSFVFLFRETAPHLEPYHVLNKGLIFILIADFLARFTFQKTPTQEVKPYLLLPVKRNRVLDFLLLRSGLSSFNYIWLCLFLPFALLTITRFFGVFGVITYCLGIYLVMVFNNYFFLLCRTLLSEKIWWILLPISILGLLGAAEFALDHPISTFTMNLCEGFIEGSLWSFAGILLAIAILWFINRQVISGFVYSEINKVEDTKVKNISEYKFLERYGEVGEYFRLELKMLFRNKRCKSSLRTIGILIIFFSLALSFMDVYDGAFMKTFIAIYNFAAFGMVILIQIMGFEGNYLDGMMTRKESILSLLKAKYYLYSLLALVPFVLIIPAIVMGKLTILSCFSYLFFTTGVVYFILFQMAVYNSKTVPLNEGLTGRQSSGTAFQSLISLLSFGLPLVLFFSFKSLLGETAALWLMLFIGISFTLTSELWIKNVYTRFMKRRYQNMEGFRNTK